MRYPELDYLLQSHDFHLIAKYQDGAEASPDAERVIWDDPFGPLTVSRMETEEHYYRLRLAEDVSVDIKPGNRIEVSAAKNTPQNTVDHFLLDQVFPRVLSDREDMVLHAAAIRVGDGAILLLGGSGSGKSTLSASFHRSGYALMGDDAIIASIEARGLATARAIYPSLRLFPDSLRALFPAPVASSPMAHYSTKQRLAVPLAGPDCGEVPLKALFVLDTDAAAGLRRLSVAQACLAVIRNSFALDPTDLQRATKRLNRASVIAQSVPAYAVSYARSYNQLDHARQLILSAISDEQPIAQAH